MAKKKLLAVKFEAVNKARILGKVGHTRTGACPSRVSAFTVGHADPGDSTTMAV